MNLIGTFLCSKYAVNHMKDLPPLGRERGLIINISSVYSRTGSKGFAAYSASKAAVQGMVLPMARDLGRFAIRVLAISPGIFMTPMNKAYPEKLVQGIAS